MSQQNSNSNVQLLATFRLREAYYAVDAAKVLEVIRPGEVTPVPHAPGEVMGVINLRGRIVTLVDMGLVIGLSPAQPNSRSRIFIVEDQGEYTGLFADEVAEVAELSEGELQSPPTNVPAERLRYCKGVCRMNSRVVLLLDTNSLLQSNLALTTTQSA